ncbi:hypothetical protein KAT51_08690 [bacterium]|nr:hypothetical protein [bacterium]
MARLTKAMLVKENTRLREALMDQSNYIIHLKEKVAILNIQPQVLQTMCMTVQRVAGVTENLLQSIPSVERAAQRKLEVKGD